MTTITEPVRSYTSASSASRALFAISSMLLPCLAAIAFSLVLPELEGWPGWPKVLHPAGAWGHMFVLAVFLGTVVPAVLLLVSSLGHHIPGVFLITPASLPLLVGTLGTYTSTQFMKTFTVFMVPEQRPEAVAVGLSQASWLQLAGACFSGVLLVSVGLVLSWTALRHAASKRTQASVRLATLAALPVAGGVIAASAVIPVSVVPAVLAAAALVLIAAMSGRTLDAEEPAPRIPALAMVGTVAAVIAFISCVVALQRFELVQSLDALSGNAGDAPSRLREGGLALRAASVASAVTGVRTRGVFWFGAALAFLPVLAVFGRALRFVRLDTKRVFAGVAVFLVLVAIVAFDAWVWTSAQEPVGELLRQMARWDS